MTPRPALPPAACPSRTELDDLNVARARRGDAAAGRALVLRYEGAVFSLLHKMLGPDRREQVEDLAQETFLRVFKALPGFQPAGPARLSTWILTIASHVAIDELRKRPREALPTDELDARASEQLPADAAARRAELARALERAAATLPVEQRLTFVLSCCEGRSHEEISAICDVDVGTVKSRLSRARARLRAALAEHHAPAGGAP